MAVRGLRRLALAIVALAAGAQGPAPAPAPSPPAPPSVVVAPPSALDGVTDDAVAGFIDGYVAAGAAEMGIPGAAVVVVRDGRTILSRGYGVADRDSGRLIDPVRTTFRQASISKVLTYILVMQEVEAGRLDLDRDINAYLDFRVDGLGGRPITARHLLTHSAGFEERLNGVFFHDPALPRSRWMQAGLPPRIAEPGAMVAYSNYGVNLLAHIVERTARRPFIELAQARVLGPLGMRSATLSQALDAEQAARLVNAYSPASREPTRFDIIDPPAAGGLTASPEDMGRLLAALMRGGAPVLQPQSIAAMERLARPIAPGLETGMGLGLYRIAHRGVVTLGHAGNLTSTATDLRYVPGAGLGWYIAVNGQGKDSSASKLRSGLERAVIDRFLAKAPLRPAAVQPSTAAEVAGNYLSTRRSYGNWLSIANFVQPLRFTADKDGVLTTGGLLNAEGSPRRFLPVGRDRFADEETGQPLIAERGPDGRVVRLGGLSPVSQWDRTGGSAHLMPALAGAAVLVLLIAAVAGPVGWISRRVLRPEPSPAPRHRLAARLAAVILLIALAAWAAAAAALAGEDAILLLNPFTNGWLRPLKLFTAFALGAVVMLALYALSRWRTPGASLGGRVSATVTALAALLIGWVFVAYRLPQLGADY